MYPPISRANERFLKPDNVGRLQSYAMKTPNKLPEIGSYVERRVRKNLRRGQYGYVSVMVQGLGKLIESVYSELDMLDNSTY